MFQNLNAGINKGIVHSNLLKFNQDTNYFGLFKNTLVQEAFTALIYLKKIMSYYILYFLPEMSV